jgi:hypothetical protein
LIRKTVSISTLGIVDFRSKKERIRRAEKAYQSAQAELIGEQTARAAADKRIAAAEKRARQAELLALQQAKKADDVRGRRRKRRQAAVGHTIEALESFVAANAPVAEEKAKELGRRGRKAAAKAAKRAEAAAEEARKQARKQGRRAKKAATPKIEQAAERLGALKDEAVERGSDLADQARKKAADLADR